MPDSDTAPASAARPFSFAVHDRIEGGLGRTGTITTPHGQIQTPAFIPVATKATVKAVRPEEMSELGAQAVLANAYHLNLQPGTDVLDAAGGLGKFMNWPGPTFTDSGGFQVMSLGVGFKKTISMDAARVADDQAMAAEHERRAFVDEDGVTFKSHIDGTEHRFTPEISMRLQHEIGADIIFAFDELTTLFNTRSYQEESLERTRRWAQRCLAAHAQLTADRSTKPYQALFGVLQGAQYEDLRRKAAQDLGAMEIEGQVFDGFGIGGALEKENLGTIVGWVCQELPENKPRHLLGISEPEDFFTAIENGADTFDCVQPSRVARNGRVYTPQGYFNIPQAKYRRDFTPVQDDCGCYTCANYSKAYLHHLFKAKEMLVHTLMTIHNEYFTVKLVDDIRAAISAGEFFAFRDETLGRYQGRI
ncbi:tRNA guanosine(34) transglycosylase Tgt [Nesterenkonia alkaliphila]|uniref:Queuine tRNA-ribosyltransferase n=1 Tax=Nesterenkonia alkaliphila TaxID=1463631 RepID=A0A7K1UFQ3_9MICC|nr:tRNA guanosine(34) transglycosylase Tgt [Nesterenkonia alkaliphila]MVT25206.1 tRNA guanosine(34) transglycosylase Tgt [Nesterenkonia alkaliphila]GFZ97598.1 queuine tRNA-ribosyltransferase [Nesterenkonia alkaliphila]